MTLDLERASEGRPPVDDTGNSARGDGPLQFGAISADPQLNAISCHGLTHHLEPKVMDLLVYLMERDGAVVTRQELLDHVWHRHHGGDESLTRSVSQLRKAFREIGACSDHIETVPKRGYRFVAHTGPQSLTDCALSEYETAAPPAQSPTPPTSPTTSAPPASAPESQMVRTRNIVVVAAIAAAFGALGAVIAVNS